MFFIALNDFELSLTRKLSLFKPNYKVSVHISNVELTF